jgi:thioredoxin-like negative regulator of GroEL
MQDRKLFALVCVVFGVAVAGWSVYTGSPAYKAQQSLAEAREHEAEGRPVKAVRAYAELHESPRHAEGLTGLGRLLEAAAQAELSVCAETLVAVSETAYAEHEAKAVFTPARSDGLVTAALEGCVESPEAAWQILKTLTPFAAAEVAAAREPVLKARVAAAPDDVGAASELALIYEQREDVEACLALLRPLVDTLGTSEGARILGQLLLYKGELEPAHALLLPYVQGRLAQLSRAEADYDRELEAGWKRGLAKLDAGDAGEAWYEAYNAADEAEQARMVQAWIAESLEEDEAMLSARERFAEATAVVPVALDLGIVKLHRAQAKADPDAREAELKAAEEVFLAIQGVAGDSAAYRLNLGKVYYWLGKGEEGHALFAALIEESERNPQVLLGVSRELRDVGAITEAKALAEEAWERAQDDELKQAAADFRGRFGGDTEEMVTWLERANANSPEVQASLAAARGRHAFANGELEEAGKQLREALRRYGELTQTSAVLNNAAIAAYDLFLVTGDRDALSTYVDRLVQAERLEPSDSILLGNVSQAFHMRALQGAASGSIDFAALRIAPGDDVVPFLAADAEGLSKVEAALAASDDLQAAISRYEKLLIVRPRDPEGYETLLALRWYGRDLAVTRALGEALQRADLDLAARLDSQTRWLEEGPDPTDRAMIGRRVELSEATVARARAVGGATFAYAAASRIELAESALGAGQELDVDALVALAEEAHEAAPSLGTRRSRIEALLLRARLRLGQSQPAFQAAEAKGWAYGAVVLVGALAAAGDEALRGAIAADPDVQQAAGWIVEQGQVFPERQQAWHWAILQAAQPDAAEACAQAVRADELGATRALIYAALDPLSVANTLDAHWRGLIVGDAERAQGVLAAARELGIPIPFE